MTGRVPGLDAGEDQPKAAPDAAPVAPAPREALSTPSGASSGTPPSASSNEPSGARGGMPHSGLSHAYGGAHGGAHGGGKPDAQASVPGNVRAGAQSGAQSGRPSGKRRAAPNGTAAFTWRHAALVFVLALIPRLAHFWFVRATPLAGEYVPDLSAYLFAVEKLMQSAYFFAEPMLMSPGYALVLAPQYILVGPDIPVFVLVNAVLDAGSAALCACLTATIAGELFCPVHDPAPGQMSGPMPGPIPVGPRWRKADPASGPDGPQGGGQSAASTAEPTAELKAGSAVAPPAEAHAEAPAKSIVEASAESLAKSTAKVSAEQTFQPAAQQIAMSAAAPAGLVPCSPSASAGRVRLAGLLAGLLYAFCGPLLFYNLLPLGEGPAVFFLLAGLVLLFAAARPAGPGEARGSLTAWLAGAMLALAALIRPNLAPAVLLALAAWCLAPDHAGSSPGMSRQTRRARLSAAGRCLAGLLLVFAPFMAHNAAVAGRPSPFGFQGGFTLYTGNHSGASGVGDALPGFDNTPYLVIMQAWAEARARTGLPLSLADADAYWYGRTWDFFAGHPAEAAGLLARKALLLVNEHGVDATADMDFCARFSPVPGWLRLPVGLLFALAAAGLWNVCRSVYRRAGQHSGQQADQNARGPSAQAAVLAVLLAVCAALVVLFQVTPRYRVVLLPLAIPFAPWP